MKILRQEQNLVNQTSKSKNAYDFQVKNSNMSFDMLLAQVGQKDYQQKVSDDKVEIKKNDDRYHKRVKNDNRQMSSKKIENRNNRDEVRSKKENDLSDEEKDINKKKDAKEIDYDLLAAFMPQDSANLQEWANKLQGQIEEAGIMLDPELKNEILNFNQLFEQIQIDQEMGNPMSLEDQMKMLQSFEEMLKGFMSQMEEISSDKSQMDESQMQLMSNLNQLLELTDEIQNFVENNPSSEGLEEIVQLINQLDNSGKLNIDKVDKNNDQEALLDQLKSQSNYDEAGEKLQVLGLAESKTNQSMLFGNQLSNQSGNMNASEVMNENLTDVSIQTSIESTLELQSKQPLKQMVFNQIMNEMTTSLKVDEQQSQMIMKLNPEALGKVELKIQMENGIIIAEMNVENETVKAAIESNLDDLRNALLDKGLDVATLDVNVNSGGHSNQNNDEMMYQSSMKRKISDREITINDLVQQDQQEIYNDAYGNDETTTMNMVG